MNKQTTTLLAILLITIASATALSATATINPQEPTTTNPLNCIVEATGQGNLQANITWYRNNNPYTTSNETINLTSTEPTSTTEQGEIPTSDTQKEQTWICQATVYNQTHTLTINSSEEEILNSPPTVTFPTSNQQATEGELFELQATAFDPDGDPITWLSLDYDQLDGEPLFEIQNDGLISFTPTYEQRGNTTMEIIASDGEESGGRTVQFTVDIVNQPPQFDPPLQNQETNDTTEWTYTISASDREEDPFNFTLLNSTLNTVQFGELNATHAQFNLTTGTPRYEDRGVHNITVMVYETGNQSHNTTETYTLTITAENDEPILENITSPPPTPQGDPFELEVHATDINPGDELFFSITGNCPVSDPWSITTTNSSPDNATGLINVTELTNDHVICRNVTISVTDFEDGDPKDTVSQTLTLNITNVNDAPTIFEIAQTPGSFNQTNMSELVGAQGIPFTYHVHADDPDFLTYEGDELTYSTNTTLFLIDSETGLINFTPTQTDAGEHLINITVTDLGGLSDSRTMNLTLFENTEPQLNPVADLECPQDTNCLVELNATDPDPGEELTFQITSLTAEPNSNQTVNPNWTQQATTTHTSNWTKNYSNNMVGVYTYNITVTDQWGAVDYQLWTVNATNVNDAPFFDDNQDQTPDNITLPLPFVDGFAVNFTVRAHDPDFINDPEENLTLTTQVQGPNTGLFNNIDKTAKDRWQITFTPSSADVGAYNATFIVTDAQGLNDTQTHEFSVLEPSIPPNVTEVTPYFDEQDNTTRFELASTAGMNHTTNVTLSEPNAYTFNFSYEDPDSAAENITVEWYINDTHVQTTTADENYWYEEQYDFFSSGEYIYQVVLTDERYANTTFTWNVEVLNVNRPPVLLENLSNRNFTQTTLIQDMLDVFYDPDDDLNSNGVIDGNEVNTLAFTHDADPDMLEIEIDYLDVKFTPLQEGTINVTWTATDEYGASVTSNTVTYMLEPEEEQETTTEPVPTSGGGGGSSPIPIPIRQDPEPEAVRILVPEQLTIHRNETIEAPVTVENTGTRTLQETLLSAETQASNVSFSWQQTRILDLQPGEQANTTLFITNFRPDGTYDVHVHAQSTNPDVNDTAIILINSLEQARQGDEAVQTRVTFARDLVASNPECLELNEVLEQASNAASSGDNQEASRLIDAAVDGCRYLISQANRRVEEPGAFSVREWLNQYRYTNHILIGLLIALLGAAALLLTHYLNAAKLEQEEN